MANWCREMHKYTCTVYIMNPYRHYGRITHSTGVHENDYAYAFAIKKFRHLMSQIICNSARRWRRQLTIHHIAYIHHILCIMQNVLMRVVYGRARVCVCVFERTNSTLYCTWNINRWFVLAFRITILIDENGIKDREREMQKVETRKRLENDKGSRKEK